MFDSPKLSFNSVKTSSKICKLLRIMDTSESVSVVS